MSAVTGSAKRSWFDTFQQMTDRVGLTDKRGRQEQEQVAKQNFDSVLIGSFGVGFVLGFASASVITTLATIILTNIIWVFDSEMSPKVCLGVSMVVTLAALVFSAFCVIILGNYQKQVTLKGLVEK